MKHKALFWHLVRFHFQIVPWFMMPLLVFLLMAISVCVGMNSFFGEGISMGSYRNYDQILAFFYVFLLGAQMTFGMQWGKAVPANQSWATGSYAFLFTRAIHRPTLYWAKLAVFFAICMIPILPTLAEAVLRPDIRIQLYQNPETRAEKLSFYQVNYPDLTLAVPAKNPKDQIVTLPGATWTQFSLKTAKVFLISLVVLWLTSLARRWPKIWIAAFAGFLILTFVPLIVMLMTKLKLGFWDTLFDDEKLLFWFHNHQAGTWLALTALTAIILWDSRQRFLKIPQYKSTLA
jgi:hypothetical protein